MGTEVGDVEAIATFLKQNLRPEVVHLVAPDGQDANVLVLPEGLEPHSIRPFVDEYRETPERRRGTAELSDLDSFIAHANRFKDADSILFANQLATPPTLLAVFDYHRAEPQPDPQSKTSSNASPPPSRARHCQHRGRYAFPFSNEWTAWTGRNASHMDQAQFAEWIENRIGDLIVPSDLGETAHDFIDRLGANFASPAKVFDLSRGLAVRVSTKLSQKKNLQNGETQFVFVSEHQDAETGAPLTVPGAFLLAIPVFRNGPRYQIPVRLRYRVGENAVRWFYELYRHDLCFDDAFKDACTKAQTETGLPLLYGSPEA